MKAEKTGGSDTPSEKGDVKRAYSVREAMDRCKWDFRFVAFFSMFINLLMLTGPLFMLQIYDRVLSSGSVPTLVALFALITLLFATLGLMEWVRSRLLNRIGIKFYRALARSAFDALMRISVVSKAGAQDRNPLNNLTQLQQYISGPGPASLFDMPWVPFYIALIFLFHPMMGWLAVAGAIALFLIALANDWRSRRPMREVSKSKARADRFSDAVRRNAEALKSLGMLSAVYQRWNKDDLDAMSHGGTARDRMGTLSAMSKALRLFLQSAMLAIGAYYVIQEQITAGVMIAGSIILGRALAPVEQSITHWRGFIGARAAYRSLEDILARLPQRTDKLPLPSPQGRLAVNGLAVAVPGTKKVVLRDIAFTVQPGQVLAIVGRSAAGKSSLVRTLAGVWTQIAGELRLDGAAYDQFDEEFLGRHIGYLPQGVELLTGTVAENISRFAADADSEDILRAAKLAGIHDMVHNLEDGYNTDIGPMGSNLSAGQRQRVALARAIYGDPPLIILDEPNSNLDEQGDQAMMQAIMTQKRQGKTIIIVSHRMNLIRMASHILELEEGRKTLFGPAADVVKQIRARRQGQVSQGIQLAPNEGGQV